MNPVMIWFLNSQFMCCNNNENNKNNKEQTLQLSRKCPIAHTLACAAVGYVFLHRIIVPI